MNNKTNSAEPSLPVHENTALSAIIRYVKSDLSLNFLMSSYCWEKLLGEDHKSRESIISDNACLKGEGKRGGGGIKKQRGS